MKTQVAIIGAGPAGLLLGHLLRAEGIDTIVLEKYSQDHVLSRIRAGVLEKVTVDLMNRLGINQRLQQQGLPHRGFNLSDGERLIHIDIASLTGESVMVYGQTEVTKDLMDAAPGRGLKIIYQAEEVALHYVDGQTPFITYEKEGKTHRLDTQLIAGCDGYHGVSRQSIPASKRTSHELAYPFGWLGLLADVPPCHEELIYASHERGFALASMRSKTRSRYYIDVPISENLADWPDERIWDELSLRLGREASEQITRGESLEKSIAPLRSFVCETMSYGRLFLAGDSTYIVPPTGAKGLNLAASDVAYLSAAMIDWFILEDEKGLKNYAQKALTRVWKAERFSWWLTKLMHRFPNDGEFERAMRVAELEYIAGSEAAQTCLAENYVGLPL